MGNGRKLNSLYGPESPNGILAEMTVSSSGPYHDVGINANDLTAIWRCCLGLDICLKLDALVA